jgi:hypothetical protein
VAARIDPPHDTVWPGGGTIFTLYVDGKVDDGASWSLSEPDIGGIDAGRFWAEDEWRLPKTTVTAKSSDGKQTATAEVRVLVGRGLMHPGPEIVDAISIPIYEPIRWNDPPGRRAAVLITETIAQLPDAFLSAVGPVSIVRVKTIDPPGGAQGMHIPLLTRLVVLAEDRLVRHLHDSPTITPDDWFFVTTLIHELAHVALANQALTDNDRWWLLTHALGTMNFPGILINPAIVYAKYFSPVSVKDFVTEYAKVTGWVINNPNPLSFIWNDTTVLPNVASGLALFGRHMGLRNPNRPVMYVPVPPPKTDAEKAAYEAKREAAFRDKGFYSTYAGVDVHEDFAESVVAMAVGDPIVNTAAFKPRLDFIVKSGIYPRTARPVEPGSVLNRWARGQKRPDSNPSDWAVYFGLYAGKPRYPAPIPLPPKAKTASVRAAAEVEGRDDDVAADTADTDEFGWAGTGSGQRYSSEDEFRTEINLVADIARTVELQDRNLDVSEPAYTRVREELAALDHPIESGEGIELLRIGECHGAGLVTLNPPPLSDEPPWAVEGHPVTVGDLMWDEYAAPYVVTAADDDGAIVQVAGTPEVQDEDKLRFARVDPGSFRYLWSLSNEPRDWVPKGHPASAAYEDLSKALTELVRLWGKATSERGRDLSEGGGFVSEVLVAAGMDVRGLKDLDGDQTADFLAGRGDGLRPPGDPVRVMIGDVVRLKRTKLWGVVTRVLEDGTPVDALVQGGRPGLVGEETDAAKMVHGVDPASIAAVWSPA